MGTKCGVLRTNVLKDMRATRHTLNADLLQVGFTFSIIKPCMCILGVLISRRKHFPVFVYDFYYPYLHHGSAV